MNDPEYRALILPSGNYAVVDISNSVVRKFNNQDDAIAYAKEKCGPKSYRIYSVVSPNGKDACLVRAANAVRAQLIARKAGVEGEVKDISQYYHNPGSDLLPNLGSQQGVIGVEPYKREDGKESVKFVVR